MESAEGVDGAGVGEGKETEQMFPGRGHLAPRNPRSGAGRSRRWRASSLYPLRYHRCDTHASVAWRIVILALVSASASVVVVVAVASLRAHNYYRGRLPITRNRSTAV